MVMSVLLRRFCLNMGVVGDICLLLIFDGLRYRMPFSNQEKHQLQDIQSLEMM